MITLLASMSMFALYGVMEQTKETRTRVQIAKLNDLILEKWEAYRSRTVRLRIPPGTSRNPRVLANARLLALRDLMRMELPDRQTDLLDFPITITVGTYPARLPAPSVWRAYRRSAGFTPRNATQIPSTWSRANESAECLYMIISQIREGDGNALGFFSASEIGDVDGDGLNEILDGWSRPIYFLRWAPGFTYHPGPDNAWGVAGVNDDNLGATDDLGERGYLGSDDMLVSDIQPVNAKEFPDLFDPLRVDARWSDNIEGNEPFAIMPLIFSAGRDGVFDLFDAPDPSPGTPFRYATVQNDPYYVFSDPNGGPDRQIGTPVDGAGDPDLPSGPDGVENWTDNITNHLIEAS
jgi:hypothetical protein